MAAPKEKKQQMPKMKLQMTYYTKPNGQQGVSKKFIPDK